MPDDKANGQPEHHAQYPPFGFGATQYGAPTQYGQPPSTHRRWAITSIVLGVSLVGIIGLILGIIATVQSGKVTQRWSAGDIAGAAWASRTTKTLCIVTTVLAVIFSLATIIFIAVWHRSTTS